jgi:hypothetical protein
MVVTKKCFKCSLEKPTTEFYKHKAMADGLLGKCKDCTKSDTKKRTDVLQLDEDWIEKERARQREKYRRLDYKEKQKEWNKGKPWKESGTLKNLNRNLKVKKGFELHHWSYNEQHFKDVFHMDIKQHRQAHKHIELDLDLRMYRDSNGVLLNTRESHRRYLESKGIEF